MTIAWYGEACFLLESGGVRILTDPPSKESGLAAPRLKADILVLSKPVEIPNTLQESFMIADPGEYEVKDIRVQGIAAPIKNKNPHTIYLIEMDGIKIAHLGYLDGDLNSEQLGILNDPDIIFLPVGGGEVLNGEAAVNLMNKIEPRLAVPSLYEIKGLKRKAAALAEFFKELGAKEAPQPKLVIKKKDLDPEVTKIAVLEAI